MKFVIKLSSLAALLFLSSFSVLRVSSGLEIGDKAPLSDLEMYNVVNDKSLSLAGANGENGLLVIFSCNTCPFVLAWEDQYPKLGELTKKNGIGMVLINSNEAKRNADDSKSAMKEHYKKANYNSSYLVDENHQLADAFGARTTPHVYLFDANLSLVYRGAINDKFEDRDKTAKKHFLNDAINALVSGKSIDPADTKPVGCSIKRVKS